MVSRAAAAAYSTEQCKGCRMSRDSDVANTIEVLLSSGKCLMLAAGSLTECQEWLQSMCQAVSQQTGVSQSTSQSVSVFLLTEPRTHAIVFMFLFTNPTNRKFSVKAVF